MRRRRRRTVPDGHAAPFLKWAGGKWRLLPEILPALPARIETYFEPFVGGGAVFFALANAHRFSRAVIADRNPELCATWSAIRDDVEGVLRALARHAPHATDEAYYYRVRAQRPARLAPAARAARVIFLNRTGFNGLYRVNSRGLFNVPFGRYANPLVYDPEGLRAAARALGGAEIAVADFAETCARARPGDAVYLDPPYVPLSPTSSFTAYHAGAFGEAEHERLARCYRDLGARGVAAVLSNSDCPTTRRLYAGLRVRTVYAARAINSVASARGPVREILVVGSPRARAPREAKRSGAERGGESARAAPPPRGAHPPRGLPAPDAADLL